MPRRTQPPPVASELDFLRWFYAAADFGPADGDVRADMLRRFREKMGGAELPPGYEGEEN
jgi:hypothetical protein